MADKNKEIKKDKPVKQVTAKKSSNTLWVCIAAAAIALITYFVFSPSLYDGFTNWDDDFYVAHNPLVANNSVPVAKIFETPVVLNYHPITVLTLALNYQFGKLDPFGYHLVNVIFHILNTILVFLFIFLLTRRNLLMASIVALFFGIHPMHVESVTWISERKDVLYVFFFLLGLIAYLRYSETKKIGWYILTFIWFILSCLSKAMAVVFPVILLLIDYLRGVKWDRRSLVEKIPFFLLSVIFGILTIKIQTGEAVFTAKSHNGLPQLLFASYGTIMYIVKLFVPFKLSAFYPRPFTVINSSVPPIFYLSPVILAGVIAALIYFFLKKEKELVFGLLFYFITMALVLQFISVGIPIMADRYSYLSYIGLLYIVAYLVNKAWQNKNSTWAAFKYPFVIITIIAAVMFSYQAYSRTLVWKNSETLWTNVIDNYPNASIAYKGLGDYYYDNNEIEKANYDYTKAIEVDSTYAGAYINRGLLYVKAGKTNLAMADFDKAVAVDSTDADAYGDCGTLYMNTGRINMAMSDFTKARTLNTASVTCYYNLGIIYSDYFNKKDSAIAAFSKAIELDPTCVAAYDNRGIVYLNSSKTNLAMADFAKVIALDSNYADAYSYLGFIYLSRGKNDSALLDCNKAIALDPTSALYHYNRGFFYKMIHDYTNAVDDFTMGIQLHPQNVGSYYAMRGICNGDLQNYTAAIADFSKAIEVNPSVPDYWRGRSYDENKIGRNNDAKSDSLKVEQLQGK